MNSARAESRGSPAHPWSAGPRTAGRRVTVPAKEAQPASDLTDVANKAGLAAGAVLLVTILAVVTIQYNASTAARAEASARSELFILRDAIDSYLATRGKVPESAAQLVAEGFLPATHRPISDAEFKRLIGR